MVSSLFCRTMILMLQQQQMNQQMQHQQNISQYLQGSQYPNAPWWTDGAMEYWPPGPPVPPAGAMSKARGAPPASVEPEAAAPAATTPPAPPAEGAAPGEGAPAPGGKADTTPAAPAAEPETTAAAPETTPAAAPDGATWEDDSWLRRCNLCGERSYWCEKPVSIRTVQ